MVTRISNAPYSLVCENVWYRTARCKVLAVFADHEQILGFGFAGQSGLVAGDSRRAGGKDEKEQEEKIHFYICEYRSPAFAKSGYVTGP